MLVVMLMLVVVVAVVVVVVESVAERRTLPLTWIVATPSSIGRPFLQL